MRKIKFSNILFFFVLILVSCTKEQPTQYEIFTQIKAQEIKGLENNMSDRELLSTHGENNEIPKNTILIFKTGDNNFGKMIFLNNTVESNILEFSYVLYDSENNIIINSNYSSVSRTYVFDFETNKQGFSSSLPDFWWEWQKFNGPDKRTDEIYFRPWGHSIFKIYE